MNRNLSVSIEEARNLYKEGSLEMKKLLLTSFSEEELTKSELPTSWDGLDEITGWWIDKECTIRRAFTTAKPVNKNVFATEKQAKSALAMAQLSQLLKVYNAGWVPDWTDTKSKYSIFRTCDSLGVSRPWSAYQFLSFKSEEIRDKFLVNFEDLIKIYFEL